MSSLEISWKLSSKNIERHEYKAAQSEWILTHCAERTGI